MTQKLFPSLSILERQTEILCPTDLEIIQKLSPTAKKDQVYFPFVTCWFFSNLACITCLLFTLERFKIQNFNLSWNLSLLIDKHYGCHCAPQEKIRQQGVYESLHRDIIAGYGKWEFDPLDLSNPFPNNEGSVHIWQGYEDKFIPYELNRYLSQQLPWIQYHEVPDAGHLLNHNVTYCEAIFKSLVSSLS